jgi:hypothetical protein
MDGCAAWNDQHIVDNHVFAQSEQQRRTFSGLPAAQCGAAVITRINVFSRTVTWALGSVLIEIWGAAEEDCGCAVSGIWTEDETLLGTGSSGSWDLSFCAGAVGFCAGTWVESWANTAEQLRTINVADLSICEKRVVIGLMIVNLLSIRNPQQEVSCVNTIRLVFLGFKYRVTVPLFV